MSSGRLRSAEQSGDRWETCRARGPLEQDWEPGSRHFIVCAANDLGHCEFFCQSLTLSLSPSLSPYPPSLSLSFSLFPPLCSLLSIFFRKKRRRETPPPSPQGRNCHFLAKAVHLSHQGVSEHLGHWGGRRWRGRRLDVTVAGHADYHASDCYIRGQELCKKENESRGIGRRY